MKQEPLLPGAFEMDEWLSGVNERKPWMQHAYGPIGQVEEIYLDKNQKWCIRLSTGDAFLANQVLFTELGESEITFYLQAASLLKHMVTELIKFGTSIKVDRKQQAKILSSLYAKQVAILKSLL